MAKRSICLNDVTAIKKFFAKLINSYNRETINTERFRTMIYGLSKYAEIYKLCDMEKKLENIEKVLTDRGL